VPRRLDESGRRTRRQSIAAAAIAAIALLGAGLLVWAVLRDADGGTGQAGPGGPGATASTSSASTAPAVPPEVTAVVRSYFGATSDLAAELQRVTDAFPLLERRERYRTTCTEAAASTLGSFGLAVEGVPQRLAEAVSDDAVPPALRGAIRDAARSVQAFVDACSSDGTIIGCDVPGGDVSAAMGRLIEEYRRLTTEELVSYVLACAAPPSTTTTAS
jgi:hypothetical protein